MLDRGVLKSHSFAMGLFQRVLDGLIIAVAMGVAVLLRDIPLNSEYLLLVTMAILLFSLFADIKGLYRSWRTENLLREIAGVFGVWLMVVACLLLAGFVTKTLSEYSWDVMVLWCMITPLGMGLMHLMYREMLRLARANGRNSRTLAFAGCCSASQKMAAHISASPWMGLRVQGVFDDRSLDRIALGNLSLEGDLKTLLARARNSEIDIVYITLPMHAERRIVHLVNQLADTTASVFIVPDIFLFDLFNAKWSTVAGVPLVSVFESPFYGINGWIKRAEDMVLGSVILLLISVPMLMIALGVKLTSPGPVIFKQRRYGLKGEIVEVWKFRSMTVCDNGDVVAQAKKNDARVTPFGMFLRRTSLDELPQFINVLQGRMSIVGPRPHAVAHNEQYRRRIQGYMLRHKVRPGITGLAQVNGWRGETDTLDKMRGRVDCDLAYVRDWSLWLDMKIIFMTIFKGFSGKNVY